MNAAKCFHFLLTPKVVITPGEMLSDPGQQIDLSMNGELLPLKPFCQDPTHL